MCAAPPKISAFTQISSLWAGREILQQILIALFPLNYSRLQIAKSCLVRKKGMKIKVGVQRDIRPCGGGVP